MSHHGHDHSHSHGHDHGSSSGGGGGGGCGDDHDHDLSTDGEQQSLFSEVDRDNVVALNAEREEMGREVIKSRDMIEDETFYCQSEDDGELMIRIPFIGTVKLRSITLRIGGGSISSPDTMNVYANSSPDFSDLASHTPTQSFSLVQISAATTYDVRISKFSSVTHLTLHFPTPTSSSYEEDTPIRVTYVSFCGDALKLRREVPTGVVYESNSRPVDHKVGGLGVGAFESKLGQ
ncbi:PITH domain-containing protein [Mrakia frigida]|uniref:PITH domain-containing protein n=1 Tax=Mrakia frigida TaxID=29902 RepID=UPI003FCC267C